MTSKSKSEAQEQSESPSQTETVTPVRNLHKIRSNVIRGWLKEIDDAESVDMTELACRMLAKVLDELYWTGRDSRQAKRDIYSIMQHLGIKDDETETEDVTVSLAEAMRLKREAVAVDAAVREAAAAS